jgi:hypothetical protein
MSTPTAHLTSRFRDGCAPRSCAPALAALGLLSGGRSCAPALAALGLLSGALLLAGSCVAYAQGAQSPLSLLNTRGIAFGSFAAGTGGAVVISPAGSRSATGGVVLISASDGAAAQFTISGDPDFVYSITLPTDGTVALTDGAGHSMEVTGFTSHPALSGQLSSGGSQALAIGASLNVGANQPAGNYSGGFLITVNYD